MIKNKIKLVCLIFIITIVSFSFVNAWGDFIDLSNDFNLESGTIIGSGITVDSFGKIIFVKENARLKIKDEIFENILPEYSEGNYEQTSHINLDYWGNIESAEFKVNEVGGEFTIDETHLEIPPYSELYFYYNKGTDSDGNTTKLGKFLLTTDETGGNFSINGNEFEVFKHQTIQYDKINGIFAGGDAKFNKIKEGQIVSGFNTKISDEIILDGVCAATKNGYLLSRGSVKYEGIDLEKTLNGEILIANDNADLSNYNKNYIQTYYTNPEGDIVDPEKYSGETFTNLKIKSSKEGGINLNFNENNPFLYFDETGLGQNEEKTFEMSVTYGDSVIIKDAKSSKNGIPQIEHTSSEGGGFSEIVTGRQTFDLKNGGFYTEVGNLNTKNRESIPFTLNSNNLKSDTLTMGEKNEYSIYDIDGNTKFTFDKSMLDNPNYVFKSDVGKELYSFAESKIGNSAFVWGGRGDVYYGGSNNDQKEKVPVEGVEAYDCIGLAQSGLVYTYGGKYSDFPPNLKLEDTLKEKGWKTYIIEPQEINENAGEEIKQIPAGSITFLMHSNYDTTSSQEGIDYKKYTNSQGENLDLTIGHTLIKGKNTNNFINAFPAHEELMPKKAREYNQQQIENGENPIFRGAIKEGDMHLYSDENYLLVMTPPEN